MAEPLRTLHSVAEDESEDVVSAVSPASSRRIPVSPIKDFSPSTFFRHAGYQRMSDDGAQEMVHFDSSDQQSRPTPSSASSPPPQLPPLGEMSPQLGAGGLGITGLPSKDSPPRMTSNGGPNNNRYSFHRKPVGSGARLPESPRSHHDLLSLAASTASSTPMIGGFPRGPPLLRSSHSKNQSSWDAQSNFAEGQELNTQGSYIGTPATTASVQGTPRQLEPRGEFSEDDFDDEVFYKGFGELVSSGPVCGKRKGS